MTDHKQRGSTRTESDLSRWGIPRPDLLARLGAKLAGGGTHITRTMMLGEVTRLLAALPAGAEASAYRAAVIEQNALGKRTESTRHRTYRHLHELYGLDPEIPLFALLRNLNGLDADSAPLLAMLIAWSRDPQFRSTTASILDARPDQRVSVDDLDQVAAPLLSPQYNRRSIRKIAKNAWSSWSQSGHLAGKMKRIRSSVQARPVSLALALMLSHAADLRGEALFGSIWCRLLDLSAAQSRSLAGQAHREGLINLRISGSVVEISFPRFHQHLGEAE